MALVVILWPHTPTSACFTLNAVIFDYGEQAIPVLGGFRWHALWVLFRSAVWAGFNSSSLPMWCCLRSLWVNFRVVLSRVPCDCEASSKLTSGCGSWAHSVLGLLELFHSPVVGVVSEHPEGTKGPYVPPFLFHLAVAFMSWLRMCLSLVGSPPTFKGKQHRLCLLSGVSRSHWKKSIGTGGIWEI